MQAGSHHGEPGSCVWSSAAVVACRFGEARRHAMPDSTPLGARSAHLSPSQRLLDDWAGARIVGLPFA